MLADLIASGYIDAHLGVIPEPAPVEPFQAYQSSDPNAALVATDAVTPEWSVKSAEQKLRTDPKYDLALTNLGGQLVRQEMRG